MDADFPPPGQIVEIRSAVDGPASAASPASMQITGNRTGQVHLDPRGLTSERYSGLLERFRATIRERLPGDAYRVEVLDRTAADLGEEARRVFRRPTTYARMLAMPGGEGAFFVPFHVDGARGCAITGFPPGYDVAGRLSRPVHKAPIATGTLDDEAFHWFALVHELGHCLIGDSEARAETFATLMALHEGKMGRDHVATLARYREADEWTNADDDDDHFVSAPVWEVVRRARSLRADPVFMAMSVQEIASLARATADRYGLDPSEIAEARAVRRALRAASAVTSAPTGRGFESRDDEFMGWVRSHAREPVLQRYDRVMEALIGGTGILPRFRIDMEGFRRGMADLAADGDAAASAVLASLDFDVHARRPPTALPVGMPIGGIPTDFDLANVSEDSP